MKEERKKQRKNIDPFVQFGFCPPGASGRYRQCSLSNWNESPEFLKKVSDWINEPKNFLVYLGSPGVGKTWLVAALINWYWDSGEEFYPIRAADLISKTQNDINEGFSENNWIYKLSDQKILIIDDLGSTRVTEWQQAAFSNLLDMRYNSRLGTVVTSNYNFPEMKKHLGFRVEDRLHATENTILENWSESKRAQGL